MKKLILVNLYFLVSLAKFKLNYGGKDSIESHGVSSGETEEIGDANTELAYSRLKLPPLERVRQFTNYAAVSECTDKQLRKWNCKSCKIAHRGDQFISSLDSERYQTRGVVIVNNQIKSIIISLRGTRNLMNVFSDIDFLFVRMKFLPKKIKVHQGFLDATNSLMPKLYRVLGELFKNERYRNYKLTFTGHSLGGAMAILTAVNVQRKFNIDWRDIFVFTYGQPRTGNKAFAHFINSKPMTLARATNYNDPVPHVASNFLADFAHSSNEVYVDGEKKQVRSCSRKFIEDITCSNSLGISEYSIKSHITYFGVRFGQAC